MPRTTSFITAKNSLKKMYPLKGSWGTLSISTPLKQEQKDTNGANLASAEKTEPIVAFSKPPPLPPVLGTLVALSLVQASSSRDGNDE